MSVLDFTRKWFRENGTRYPNAFATTPLCCPSRASIFSGRYAHNHGVEVNHAVPDLNFEKTIQKHLDDAGYETAFIGKYLNNWALKEPPPYFDRFAFFVPTIEERFAGKLYSKLRLNVDGTIGSAPKYSTHLIRDHVLSYLEDFEETDGRPWFIMAAPYAPHLPAIPEPKYEDAPLPPFKRTPAQKEKDLSDKPDVFADIQHEEHGSRGTRKAQLRSLMSVDDMVERFASALDCLGETNDTYAIFMSDNGYLWGEHDLRRKGAPYTEAVEVPLLTRWPGGQHPKVDERVAANIDLAPTIADLAELPRRVADNMDGESMLRPSRRRDLLLEFWPNRREDIPRWNTLRTRRYHYTEYENSKGKTIAREFYDLKRDPWLLRNLLGDKTRKNDPSAAQLDSLEKRLAELGSCESTTCREP